MPRTVLSRCRSLRSMRSGRNRCRTNGFWGRSLASRPTAMTASGSCPGWPGAVAVEGLGKEVFAADGSANRRVVVFDSETGHYKLHWGAYGKPPSDEKTPSYGPAKPPSQQFGTPVHCIRIDKNGLVY